MCVAGKDEPGEHDHDVGHTQKGVGQEPHREEVCTEVRKKLSLKKIMDDF